MKFYEANFDKKVLIIRIDRDEEIISTLESIVIQSEIEAGFFMGIGAIKNAIISFYDYNTKSYIDKEINEEMEVVSLLGNISYQYAENKPFIHAHVALSNRDFGVIGGHLKKAIVGVTIEIAVFTIVDRIERIYSPDFNLFFWKP